MSKVAVLVEVCCETCCRPLDAYVREGVVYVQTIHRCTDEAEMKELKEQQAKDGER